MPGQAKITSMITAAFSMTTRLMPASVSTGISAFLNACIAITTNAGRPFSRASLMYSLRSTSSMLDRVRRSSDAAKYQPSATAGMIRLRQPPCPLVGSQSEPHREHQDHHQPKPEARHRQAEQRDGLADVVPRAVDPHRRDDAGGNADHERDQRRGQRELQRIRQALEIQRAHRHLVVERLAEFAGDDVLHEGRVLHRQRPIEAPFRAHQRQIGFLCAGLRHQRHRVTREPDHREDGQAQDEQGDNGIQRAPNDELCPSPCLHGLCELDVLPRIGSSRW